MNPVTGRVLLVTNEISNIMLRKIGISSAITSLHRQLPAFNANLTNHGKFTLAQHQTRNLASTIPTSANGTSTTNPEQQEGGFLKRLVNKMGFMDNSRVRLRMSSCVLYESVADNINYAEFFTYFNMPDSFNTWFLITELHVWMLLVRAMAEGPEKDAAGRFLRNCIVESLWNDVTTRAKKLSADNPSAVRPQITLLSEQFQAALISYDEGISFDDKALAAALWRRFFNSKCEDYEKLELLVQYVRKQMAMLDGINRYDFAIKPKIKWLPLIEKNAV